VAVEDILNDPPVADGRPWPLQAALSWARDLVPWRSAGDGYTYEQRLGGLGAQWILLGAPLLTGLLVLKARARRLAPTLEIVGPLLLVYAAQPYTWWSRFSLSLAAAGSIAIAYSVERLPSRFARVGLAAATAGCVLVGAWYANWKVNPAGHGRVLDAPAVVGLLGEPASNRTIGRLFFPEYAWIDEAPPGSSVAVELSEEVRFVYPLFGSGFERQVRRLDSVGRSSADGAVADYLLVGRGGPNDVAAAANPRLTLAYENSAVRAYRRR
jgi:hypothetical protein